MPNKQSKKETNMKKTSKPSVKPISNIVRKYARASFAVSTFGWSEGYELKANYAGTIFLGYNTLPLKAAAHNESVERGKVFIAIATQNIIDAGFTVTAINDLQINITN